MSPLSIPPNRLIIGTRRYSSWSLRGWLAVLLAGLDVSIEVIPLAGGATPAVKQATPSGTVPVLFHEGATIWESLAIGEYCAEHAPSLWPADRLARAHARAIASEMHAGFRALRQAMPMNVGIVRPGHGSTPEALADIARIEAIWREAQTNQSGPYLYGGALTIADCMYAPVVARLLTYEPALGAASRAYCEAVRAHPLMERWYREAAEEPVEWQLKQYEA